MVSSVAERRATLCEPQTETAFKFELGSQPVFQLVSWFVSADLEKFVSPFPYQLGYAVNSGTGISAVANSPEPAVFENAFHGRSRYCIILDWSQCFPENNRASNENLPPPMKTKVITMRVYKIASCGSR